MYETHFPEAITTNMQIGKDFYVLNTQLRVNKNFQNLITFYCNFYQRLSFMYSPRNDKHNPSYSKTLLSIKSLLRTWF